MTEHIQHSEATPRTDALFAKHVAEAKSRAGDGKETLPQLAFRQVQEVLEHARSLERKLAELRRELEEAVEFTIRAQDAEIAERKKAETADSAARELWEILSYFVSNHHGPHCKCNWCATFEKHRAKYGRK